MRRSLPLWALFLAPLALLLPGIQGVFFAHELAKFSDLLIAHEPYAVFVRQALLEYGQVPLWQPSILSGHPAAANPLVGLWYPPGWLALLLPLPFGMNLLAALHLGWGGVGAYRLLRLEGAGGLAAFLGGLAFALLPKLFAHFGAGHLTLIYAIAWTPWLLAETRTVRARITPGLILALITTADPRWTPYAGGLWVVYGLLFMPVSWGRRALRLGGQAVLGGLLAAPLLLPLVELTRHSTRADLSAAEASVFSLPPAQILGLLFPVSGGGHEWTLYSGAGVLVLALLAVAWRGLHTAARFWLLAALAGLLLALGPSLPFYGLLVSLPGFDLLRVPSRALFILGLGMALAAGHAVQAVLDGPDEKARRRGGLLLAGLASAAILLGAGIWYLTGSLPPGLGWGVSMLVLACVWCGLALAQRTAPGVWWVGLLALCLVDWTGAGRAQLDARPVEQAYAPHPAAAYLAQQPGQFRVYSPSYSLPQHLAARYGLELADGVDPLQLAAYAGFMEAATGVPRQGYSVTLPPFGEDDPAQANAAYRPDPDLLGLLNVAYMAAEFDLEVEGLDLVQTFGQTRLYANRYVRPRAWFQPVNAPVGAAIEPAAGVEWSPNRIRVSLPAAESVRLLVLSELSFPGWYVQVDGRPIRLQTLDVPLRAVLVPAGAKEAVFTYRPLSLYVGLALAMAAGVFVIFWGLRRIIGVGMLPVVGARPTAPESWIISRLRRASRFRFVLILLSVLLTSLPYLLGFAAQGGDWRFTGFLFGVEDGNSYIAKMLSGAYGAWLFRTPYTGEAQNGMLAFLPYLLLGKLAGGAGLHTQLVVLYHLFRIAAVALAIHATADFLAVFISNPLARRWAVVLAVLGGGLGWTLALVGRAEWLGSLPLDFISPETFGFLALYGLPHLALARALLLWGLALYMRRAERQPAEKVSWWAWDRTGARIGALWLLLGLAQPLTVLIAWLVLGLHLLATGADLLRLRSRPGQDLWLGDLRCALWAGLVSAPLVVYTFMASTFDPFFRSWTGQNLITSPHPLHYLLAYGLLLPLAVRGGRRLLAENPRRAWLLIAWLAALPVLVYLPFNLQRRLAEGGWVALVALAAVAVQPWARRVAWGRNGYHPGKQDPAAERSPARSLAFILVGSFSLLTTLFLLLGGALAAVNPRLPVFRLEGEAAAFEYLREAARPGEVVLAAFETANALPAWAPVRVLVGHGPESANFAVRLAEVEAFYQGELSRVDQARYLQENSIRYVFWGPAERRLGAWAPEPGIPLRRIFQAGEYSIFIVEAEREINP